MLMLFSQSQQWLPRFSDYSANVLGRLTTTFSCSINQYIIDSKSQWSLSQHDNSSNMFFFFVLESCQRGQFKIALQIPMPKAVDVYVLESKIGAGQFGDVYRGYSKVDGRDVAVKTIRRDKIKGKFTQLLESEIQVLKSCKNNNIIQLIDIKKTANNIYLVLEYCNEGDLMAYLKSKKKLPPEEALEYFVQILHAFQTLVKNKIMHRDFKLANVLKHEGTIKIADFGFAKLLGSEDQQVETILGSPLNMAPEVLDHQHYNSKADIWSIGVAFYELIFGKVPYSAANIIDLLKKIKKDPVIFPQKLHPQIEDVIRRMLVVDPAKRIEWSDLFRHPVTRLLQDNIEENLKQSFLCKKEDLPLSMSRFYIKTNKVIENIHDIIAKKQLNNYVKGVIKNQQKAPYQGPVIRRLSERQGKQKFEDLHSLPTKTEKQLKDQEQDSQTQIKEKENALLLKLRRNAKELLQHRNSYAFLGHLAEELLETRYNQHYQALAFLLVKKAMSRVCNLRSSIKKRQIKQINCWQQFEQSPQYMEVLDLLKAEEQIFSGFYEKLSLRVFEEGSLSKFQEDIMISGKYTLQETNHRIYERVLRAYLARVPQPLSFNAAAHVLKLLDSLKSDIKFSQHQFDFVSYYQQYLQTEENILKQNAKLKLQALLSSTL